MSGPSPSGEDTTRPGWLLRRVQGPNQFRISGDEFADVTLHCGDQSFPVHKLILASHSDFFLNLFRSGMREAKENVIDVHDVDPEVCSKVLDYLYTGEIVPELSFELTKDLLTVANMWQIKDMETYVLSSLVKSCIPQHCLKIFLFVTGIGDFFFDDDNRIYQRQIERVLLDTVRDRWHLVVSPSNHIESLTDDYVCTFTKLDYASVKKILRIKSDQEEISDFTFSFNQSDICLAAVQWIKADLVDRIGYLTDLSECFCLHQISGSAKSALASLTKEGGHPSLSFEDCCGQWCPEKKITGLVINHGWSPNVLNTLTSDHIFHYFTIPRSMSNSHSGPLHAEFFYDLGTFGELSAGEKHLLCTNNCPQLESIDSRILLTLDSGTISGTVIDPISSRFDCGKEHHSSMMRFCPSSIKECVCEFSTTSVCSDGRKVFVIKCHTCNDQENQYNPNCGIFQDLKCPEGRNNCNLFGFMTFVFKGKLYLFGGFNLLSGNNFSLVHCSYDLQDLGPLQGDPNNYKSGHSHIKTSLGFLKDTPLPNVQCLVRGVDSGSDRWTVFTDMKVPWTRSVGDAATVIFRDELYCIGGSEVAYDEDRHIFYQKPTRMVWIFSFTDMSWRSGPDLPSRRDANDGDGITRGSAFVFKDRLYFSGGAQLQVNHNDETNQIYEYIPNMRVFELHGNTWSTILDLTGFANSLDRTSEYSVYSVYPCEVALKRLKMRKDHQGTNFLVKFVNISFPSGQKKRSEDMRK